MDEAISQIECTGGHDAARSQREGCLVAHDEANRDGRDREPRGPLQRSSKRRGEVTLAAGLRRGEIQRTADAQVSDREAVEPDDIIEMDPAEPLPAAAQRPSEPQPKRQRYEAHQLGAWGEDEAGSKEGDSQTKRLGPERRLLPATTHESEERLLAIRRPSLPARRRLIVLRRWVGVPVGVPVRP